MPRDRIDLESNTEWGEPSDVNLLLSNCNLCWKSFTKQDILKLWENSTNWWELIIKVVS